ncbi:MAG TPA: glucosidase [Stellaceae bacterium]|nr:glucosidase [Stellaceae bacterium]
MQNGRDGGAQKIMLTAEGYRLDQTGHGASWRRWGPYVSERQWGTVREDYSEYGTAWDYFPHDQARSRAYRWGEDGIAGFCDRHQWLCLGLGLWNGRDPILKERLFGLTNSEGNHGEDVKEIYYYLDCTPTHSYQRMLYRYPQEAYPYSLLVEENRRRGPHDPEFEITDTGVFENSRYFDVEVEYAKAEPDNILMLVTVHNRGSAPATIDILPHIWFRNLWSWSPISKKPRLVGVRGARIRVEHLHLPPMKLLCDGAPELLFCENETNSRRLFGLAGNGYFKDGINDFIVSGSRAAVNPYPVGTKAAAHYHFEVPARGSVAVRVRLQPDDDDSRFEDFDSVMKRRRHEADEFHEAISKDVADGDPRLVQRQALAGMLWTKQFYHIDMRVWLKGDPLQPPASRSRLHVRNADWPHLYNEQIMSMPDKWEYPWYAAWDLAFHCVVFALIDPAYAKEQLVLLTREWYMHPNGQLPAYEWAWGDVNPPVHAWAAWSVYSMDRETNGGRGDRHFLERVFHKLMLNFTWWVNRKDAEGRNIFQGGFLGLDNIGIFDRSAPLPTGGYINQSDGTAWVAMYTLNLLRISLELGLEDPVYEDIAVKFFEHFLYIAEAMTNIGGAGIGLWDEQDEFYYDVLQLPDGERIPLRVRSMVGLIPIFAVEVLEGSVFRELKEFADHTRWFLDNRPDLAGLVSRWHEVSGGEDHLMSLLRGHRLKCLLRRMLDEDEFLSDYGIRALSKHHEKHPFRFEHAGQQYGVSYLPGESTSGVFGGNSNWRGPIWMPVNFLLIESLGRFHRYYGPDFKVECPTRSGVYMNLNQVAAELSRRLARLFLRDENGHRPVLGSSPLFRNDPDFRENPLFYEYFHGDTGAGLGASHQTGWTGLIALLLRPRPRAGAGVLPAAVAEPEARRGNLGSTNLSRSSTAPRPAP